MHALAAPRLYSCARYLRATRVRNYPVSVRTITNGSVWRNEVGASQQEQHHGAQYEDRRPGNEGKNQPTKDIEEEEGALTRRLRNLAEDALETGGHGAIKAIDEAGFSAQLKAELEQRIAAANFRSSEADLPPAASRHARDLATAEAWTGTESLHDASFRMLNDAYKPMRLGRPPKIPGVQPPQSVDTGHKRSKDGRGLRLANARDRSTVYASLKDDAALEAADREKRLQELKDRFDPHARVIVPGTIQGLSSLANNRIEDAIARGQFKNIPRGKGKNVERDHNASSPFIDTTEYFMNKIIQKQDIVPPWIEKQQELTSAANKFRSRLRADWKRHAARMIASKGGSLHDQIRRAEAYAKAELIVDSPKKKKDVLTAVDNHGQLSQISLSGELKVSSPEGSGMSAIASEEITAERITLDASPENLAESSAKPVVEGSSTQAIQVPISNLASTVPPAPYPFRDPDWERIEHAYHTVAIKDLNDKARSYNLQAPDLAKKPYFNLQRELNSCFVDVAPQLAEAILDRARRPAKKAEGFGHSSGEKSVFGNLVGGPVRVRDERKGKQYGFRQFWKDLWADKSSTTY